MKKYEVLPTTKKAIIYEEMAKWLNSQQDDPDKAEIFV